MVLTCRELSRGISTYVVGDDPKTKQKQANCARLIKAYTIAVKLSCRKTEGARHVELMELLTKEEYQRIKEIKKNFPVIILQWLGKAIAEFDGQLLFPRAIDFMEREVGTLMEAWMGMQKLATTPFPFPYIQVAVTLLHMYMYTVAITIAIKYRYVGILPSGLLAFALFGLFMIGSELEDPFGEEANDLDLDFFVAGSNAACKAMLPPMLSPDALEPVGVPQVGTAKTAELGNPSAAVHAQASTTAGDSLPLEADAIKRELRACITLESLSPQLQDTFRTFFDRYDLDHSGKINNSKELTQLVTNLAFSLKLGSFLTQILEHVEQEGETISWDVEYFVSWFLPKLQIIGV